MTLKAHEYPLKKVFSSDFDFAIPDYQRPYAWGNEQALQLLDDLKDTLDRSSDEPYFLGSLVLVKPDEDSPAADVIDGQQRLTTLTILLAVLRDLTASDEDASVLSDMVLEPGIKLDGIMPKPRLTLREQDAAFFGQHVQQPGQIESLIELTNQQMATDSQTKIRDNAKALRARLMEWSDDDREALASLVRNDTFLVVVSTPELASAHRIFSVMNARGLDLSPADIFKSRTIGAIDESVRAEYAKKWETEEQNLGRREFADLFLHIRTIVAKVRGKRELLAEFQAQVLDNYLARGKAKEFVDDVVLPYAQAHHHALKQDFDPHDKHWVEVNDWLKRLAQLDNNDWRPPALWAMRTHPDNPAFLSAFLKRLERLAASMLVRRVYATPRSLRYIELLKQIEQADDPLAAEAFELDEEEREETLARLGGDIYLVNPVRRYVLLRLDELIANNPGVKFDHKIITVEHVLPQSPALDSDWVKHFDEEQRREWTHKLGNLLLLNRQRNSAAQNYDFAKKKTKYFTDSQGSSPFSITTPVVGMAEWTPAVVEERHHKLLDQLAKEWELT